MNRLLYVFGGIILGVGLSILGYKYFTDKYDNPPGYFLEATYFVEVPKNAFEKFTFDLFRHLDEVRGSGYIMGTSDMVAIRANGECGDDRELEAYLSDYAKSNQFVCFMIRRAK